MTLQEMIAKLRAKSYTGRGIGLAESYIRTAIGSKQFAGRNELIEKALKECADKMVYRDPKANITFIAKSKKGGGLIKEGESARPNVGESLSEKSVLEFENILTTAEQDRDGDELAPKGAKVDPKAPLLWQHLPMEPIGKLFGVVEQNDQLVKTHCGIADTKMGNDAALLVEYGALRISHGFKPLKFEPIKGAKGDEEFDGWKVFEYEVMEVSLVSIPANTGAVITAFSRGKLHSPVIKSWAEEMYRDRPVMLSVGDRVKRKKRMTQPVAVHVHVGGKKSKDTTEEGFHSCKGHGCTHKSHAAPKKKDDDEEEDDEVEEGSELEEQETAETEAVLLNEVSEQLSALANTEGLSSEAKARLGVVSSILEEVAGAVEETMAKLADAGGNMDIAGVSKASGEMAANCHGKLTRAVEELQRIAGMDDLPDNVADGVLSAGASMSTIVDAIGGMKEGVGNDSDTMPVEGADEGKAQVQCECGFQGDGNPGDECPNCGGELTAIAKEDDDAETQEDDVEDDTEEKAKGQYQCNDCGKTWSGEGEDGDYGAQSCPKCGSHATTFVDFRDEEVETPEDESDDEKEMTHCPECHALYDDEDGSGACPDCGYMKSEEDSDEPDDNETDEEKEGSEVPNPKVTPQDGSSDEDNYGNEQDEDKATQCLTCEADLGEGDKFCSQCGEKVPDAKGDDVGSEEDTVMDDDSVEHPASKDGDPIDAENPDAELEPEDENPGVPPDGKSIIASLFAGTKMSKSDLRAISKLAKDRLAAAS